MSESESYLINRVGTCRNCVVDFMIHNWEPCDLCNVLMCPTHYKASLKCDLCKYVPDDHDVCIICDCPTISRSGSWSDNMSFSDSRVSCTTVVEFCDDCRKNFIEPHVHPNKADVHYQTFSDVLQEHGGVYIGGPWYDLFRAGNELNYKLIQDGRKQLIAHYKKTVPTVILPEIAMLIIEYCGFARDIVFEGGIF